MLIGAGSAVVGGYYVMRHVVGQHDKKLTAVATRMDAQERLEERTTATIQTHETRVSKLEASHDALRESLSAHKIFAAETFARKDEVSLAVKEVKDSFEGMRKDVIDAILTSPRGSTLMALTVLLPIQDLPLIAALALLFAVAIPPFSVGGPWYRRGAASAVYAVARVFLAVLCGLGLWTATTVGGAFFQVAIAAKVRSEAPPAMPPKPANPERPA